MEIPISEEQEQELLMGIFENFPEASSGMALVCDGWSYKKFEFHFVDTETGKEYIINKEMATRALREFIALAVKGDMVLDVQNFDADTSDSLAQLAIFGKVIYG